jgi:DNA-binding IclR family transcriptional regulator
MLDRLTDWAQAAREATAAIKGQNPARIIAALAAHPILHTAQVEDLAGISRDTAERLLSRMRGMGLVREITGARRFRLWAAAV